MPGLRFKDFKLMMNLLLRLDGELLFFFGFFSYDDSLSLDSILLRVSKNR